MTRFWEILLLEWRNRGRDGLTIPFLIGTQQYLTNHPKWLNVEELIIYIAKNSEHPVSIRYCYTINDIILELMDERAAKNAGHFPTLNGRKQENLYLTKFLQDHGNDLKTIASKLALKYQERIDKCEYSTVNRLPSSYTSDEIKFITESFQILKLIK